MREIPTIHPNIYNNIKNGYNENAVEHYNQREIAIGTMVGYVNFSNQGVYDVRDEVQEKINMYGFPYIAKVERNPEYRTGDIKIGQGRVRTHDPKYDVFLRIDV